MQNHLLASDVSQSLALALGHPQKLIRWQAVVGGSIHQAWHVENDSKQHFFIKINHVNKRHTLQAETTGLNELQSHITQDNPLRIPKTYALNHNKTHAWLILEYMAVSTGQRNTLSYDVKMECQKWFLEHE